MPTTTRKTENKLAWLTSRGTASDRSGWTSLLGFGLSRPECLRAHTMSASIRPCCWIVNGSSWTVPGEKRIAPTKEMDYDTDQYSMIGGIGREPVAGVGAESSSGNREGADEE